MSITTSAHERIRCTIAKFCHYTDSGDFDNWVQLFTEDGCFSMFGRQVRGRDALRAFIADDQPPERRGLHLTTDSVITITGERAEVCSNFIFIAAGESAAVVVTAGRYHDILVPRGEAWLFAEREAKLMLPVASQAWGAHASGAATLGSS